MSEPRDNSGRSGGDRVADSTRRGKPRVGVDVGATHGSGHAPERSSLGRGGARIERLVEMALGAVAPDESRPIAEIGYDLGQIMLRIAERSSLGIVGVEVQPDSAQLTPVPAALRQRVELRTGDGLDPIRVGESAGVILAGLGGKTIAEVLRRAPAVVNAVDFVLTCPSHLEAEIRPALNELGLDISDEQLVFDRGRYYECVLARPRDASATAAATIDPIETTWGPVLMRRPDPLMAAYLDDQAHRFRDALATDLRSYTSPERARLGAKLRSLAEARARLG
jgi:tRNA (adenine22-N1)-methyltransferase